MNRMIAAAVAEAWNSGSSMLAKCSTRLAKTDMNDDMGEPSGGLVGRKRKGFRRDGLRTRCS
ncbi:hypothetical protein GCM10010431_71260 [Streptomyces kunmingensis]